MKDWTWRDGEPDHDWLDARADWNRAVRNELDARAARDYDSPLLVATRIQREVETLPRRRWRHIHEAWVAWDEERHKPEPDTVPVWLDDYLAKDALAFARGLKSPAVIWCQSRALRNRIAELGQIPNYGPERLPPENPAHLCVASIRAHGTGRNLQAWHEAVIVEPPAGPWEQLLGRHHRRKQAADEVVFYHYDHAEPFRKALANARKAEEFAADTGGERRRLLYADKGRRISR